MIRWDESRPVVVSHDRPTASSRHVASGGLNPKAPHVDQDVECHVVYTNKTRTNTRSPPYIKAGVAAARPTDRRHTRRRRTPRRRRRRRSTDADGRRSRVFFSLAPRASRGRALGVASDARAHRSDGQIGFSRAAAAGAVDRGRARGRIVDEADDATRAWGRKRAWEVKRKRPRAVAETRGRKTRGRRRGRGRERATDRRRGRRSNSCDES